MAEPNRYPGPERRTGAMTQDHVQLLVQREVDQHLDRAIGSLKEHIDSRMAEQKDFIKSAFPEGDMHGHMLAHKAMMKLADERAARWNKLWDRVLVGGGYSIIVALAMLAWESFKSSVKQ